MIRVMRHLVWALALGLCVTLIPSSVCAHAFQPALLEIHERDDGDYDVVWKASTSVGETGQAPSEVLAPKLPERCEATGQRRASEMSGRRVERWTIDCGSEGLAGAPVGVDGLDATTNDVLVRYSGQDGTTSSTVLNRETPTVSPAAVSDMDEAGAWSVARTYLGLGVEHILLGFDHLLFVLGLLLLVRGRRALVATITAFTLAHSITLALSSLGILTLPQMAVEAVIAASLMLLAVEIVRKQRGADGWTARAPWGVAFAFGLLHGFGFAGALRDIGLPSSELPVALASFNIGVEVGQLGVVAAWVVAAAALERVQKERPDWLPRAASYVIGVPASYWLFERVAGILRL